MKNWLLSLPLREIYKASETNRIEPELVAAIVAVESGGKSCATRYEPHYRYTLDEKIFAKKNYITGDTEIIHQKTSWGLMQVMGAVAREHGYLGPLNSLCTPQLGLQYGIQHIAKFIDKYEGDLQAAISAYNQGGDYRLESGAFKNQVYVDKIMEKYQYLKGI